VILSLHHFIYTSAISRELPRPNHHLQFTSPSQKTIITFLLSLSFTIIKHNPRSPSVPSIQLCYNSSIIHNCHRESAIHNHLNHKSIPPANSHLFFFSVLNQHHLQAKSEIKNQSPQTQRRRALRPRWASPLHQFCHGVATSSPTKPRHPLSCAATPLHLSTSASLFLPVQSVQHRR
jgi:hypothetical protein